MKELQKAAVLGTELALRKALTFRRRNYFFNFSTLCI